MPRPRPPLALALASVLTVAALACSEQETPEPPSPAGLPKGTLSIQTATGGVELAVEVADTQRARSTGLMNRPRLDPDAGMVFLFPASTDGPFWMKDTLIPLSIAFWDGDGRIVAVLDMEPCEADPCPLYSPEATYVAAVEVNQGWFEDHGVAIGDVVSLER
jgi:uncharacterized membrane protein (UPF0127 family)